MVDQKKKIRAKNDIYIIAKDVDISSSNNKAETNRTFFLYLLGQMISSE